MASLFYHPTRFYIADDRQGLRGRSFSNPALPFSK
jgi:hypothetical protein